MKRLAITALALVALATCVGAQSPTEKDHPPITPAPPPDASQLNKSLLKFVEDDAPVRGPKENPDEALAYDYVVRFAKDVPLESFRQAAVQRLTFADLLGPEAALHRGSVAHVEGRLKRIRDIGPTTALEADGIKNLYECWIVSDAYRGYAYCLICTELPPDIVPGEQLDQRVKFDAYFYKIYRFRAEDGMRRSPLLIGRSLSTRPVPTQPIWDSTGMQIPIAIGATVAGVFAIGVFLLWWFNRDDAAIRERLKAARRPATPEANPFAEESAPEPTRSFIEYPFGGSPSLN